MIGRKLSNFHINERIGEGGMGTVYKATDLSLNRTVAVKMLHPFLVSNPDSFKRFRNEAHLSARISHPNVATLFDFQESDNSHFIVMEYVDGKALDDVLKLQGCLPEKEAVKIVLQVLEGLGAAHELGIMHRDLKPGNIMVTKRGFVKLMDFGIARLENTERMTRQNSVIGTLEYLSPELVKGAAPSKASDLYAVGVMLYEMLSGHTLYAGDSEASLMYQIAHKPAKIDGKGLSRNLVQVIKKLTHKQVSKRYQSTQEVIRDLEKIHSGGKVNTLLLNQKLEPGKQDRKPAVALPFNMPKPQVGNLQKVRLPFDIDVRILAGALVLCLIILLVGLVGSPDSPKEPNGPEIIENGEVTQQEEQSSNVSDNYAALTLPANREPKNKIEFIERFDEAPEAPEKEEENNARTRKTEETRKSTTVKQKENTGSGNESASSKKDVIAEKTTRTQQTSPDEKKASEPKTAEDPSSSIKKEVKPVKAETSSISDRKEEEAPPRRQSVKVRIPDMYMSASFITPVSTEKNFQGQTIYLASSSNIYQGEHLIVAKGARVRAVVKKLRKADGKKKAFLALNLLAVQAVNGDWLAISYPEYSNISKTEVEFSRGLQLSKIKLKSTNITLKK